MNGNDDGTHDLTGFAGAAGVFRSHYAPETLAEVEEMLGRIQRRTLEASADFVEHFNRRALSPIRPLIQGTAQAIDRLFQGLVDGSVRSGRAFAAVMLDAVGKFATAMGEAMVATAKVLQALMVLNIPATFAGGFALIAIGASLSAFASTLGGSGAGTAPAPVQPPEPEDSTERRLPAELTVNVINNGGVLGLDNVKQFITDAVREAIGDDRLAVVDGPNGLRVL